MRTPSSSECYTAYNYVQLVNPWLLTREQLVLHVARSNNVDASVEYRLVWCPFGMSGSDEVEYLFAVALGTRVSDIMLITEMLTWLQCTVTIVTWLQCTVTDSV